MKNTIILVCFILFTFTNNLVELNENDSNISDISDKELENILYDFIQNDDEQQKFIPGKEKKNKNNSQKEKEEEEENSPIPNHRRKNGDLTSLITNNDVDNLQEKSRTCSTTHYKVEPNLIINSKESIQKGAKLLTVEYISKDTAQKGLNKLQESCMSKCCQSDSCDSTLLSMRLGEDGYRCYLFSCNQNCLYVKHNDYIVMRMKSPEQLDHIQDKNLIMTGHKDSKTPCHKQYEFTCSISKKCIPIYDVCNSFDDCDDKTDELNCTTSSYKPITATSKKITTSITKVNNAYKQSFDDDALIEANKNQYKDYKIENDYDYDLIKQQADIVDYLNELIGESKYKNKIVHKSPKDFFDSFMKTAEIKATTTTTKSYKLRTTSPSVSTSKKTTFFYDELNVANDDKLLENVGQNDKIYFLSKENAATSTSEIVLAVFLLVIGISLMLALFTYLILSTKYMRKRITWLRKINMKHKNVDVDPTLEADYLINGMYL